MPRHIIHDAHEWINEIPTVPIYYLAKPQPSKHSGEGRPCPRPRVLTISLKSIKKHCMCLTL
ncbi:hypothetical protein WUBG_06322 [Wuchereria bancrofti]|uniref:Uncharacterized protein n=1 Tax=Wuchereria bancrofti TaxID=6293 RepID=J9F5Y7_WUCBA|nr:hypothetical protein WUBG_06322 [Wuchereria bancrofti]